MKICVYAICKNEEKNVDAWVESMSEADNIVVLDTGSDDNTVKKLKDLGVDVYEKKINPWRFDTARNLSFSLCPSVDLYVCTDLDERFEKGWRKTLEDNYSKEYTRVKYTYNWAKGFMFYLDKIHTKDYVWTHPVHEVLTPLKNEKSLLIKDIILNHYQDTNKNRGSYLPLLELSVEEDPEDDRNMHYLAREYMYYEMYEKAIKFFHKHLSLPKATWKDERSASMRYMARCYKNLKYYEEALMWYNLAIKEAPYLRENYVEAAFLKCDLGKYNDAYENLKDALKIKEKSISYINEEFAWNYLVYDLLAISSFYIGKKEEALKYNEIALKLNPNDERIKNNGKIINSSL